SRSRSTSSASRPPCCSSRRYPRWASRTSRCCSRSRREPFGPLQRRREQDAVRDLRRLRAHADRLALYGGVALGLEDAHQRELLPLFPRGQAAESFEGFETQLERLEAEPGVRQQL